MFSQTGAVTLRTDPITGGDIKLFTSKDIVMTADNSMIVSAPSIRMGGDLIMTDNTSVQLGDTSNLASNKCTSILLQAAGPIPANRVVKIVDVGGQARITTVKAADPDSTAVVGVTMNPALALGDDVKVCIGGLFSAVVQSGFTTTVGGHIEKSDALLDDGRVVTNPAGTGSPGTFGVALEAVTGDVAGTVKVRGMYLRNEIF